RGFHVTGVQTCALPIYCEEACPVMNNHVSHIIDMRRYLVMTEGKMDPEQQRAVMNIERQGNPWGLSKKDRIKWRELDEDVYIPKIGRASCRERARPAGE